MMEPIAKALHRSRTALRAVLPEIEGIAALAPLNHVQAGRLADIRLTLATEGDDLVALDCAAVALMKASALLDAVAEVFALNEHQEAARTEAHEACRLAYSASQLASEVRDEGEAAA